MLWLQRHVTSGFIKLLRQPGSCNPADLGTKHVDAATMHKHMEFMGFSYMSGRSSIALRAAL
eukprot:2676949-Amphidinium_carterae.1